MRPSIPLAAAFPRTPASLRVGRSVCAITSGPSARRRSRVSYTSPTGTGTSTGRDIDMTITFGSLITITSCVDLPGLAPGGYHDVKLTADFRNEVDEERESNNTSGLKITRSTP